MNKITIIISTANAAFDPDPNQEVANILAGVLDKFNSTGRFESQPLRDTNGNIVGSVKVEE